MRNNSEKNIFRNPLTVFGLILLAGDGPLVVLYSMARNEMQQWLSLVATIIFIFCMGGFFFYLVVNRPRHLFAPSEIPESAYGKKIYRETVFDEAKTVLKEIQTTENIEKRDQLVDRLNTHLLVAQDLQEAYELLLFKGYDISLIFDILKQVDKYKFLDCEKTAKELILTVATIENIKNSMIERDLIILLHGDFYLTEKGIKLMDVLEKYLR
jgi:predicted transcriptional regulator